MTRPKWVMVLALSCALLSCACGVLTHAPANMPRSMVRPTVGGTPVIGQTLISSDGSWASRPGSYAYHWQDCANKAYCIRISGATSKSYTVRANDFGYSIRSEVTACNARGCSSAFSPLRRKAGGKQPSGVGLPPSVQTDSFGTTWKEVGEDDFTVDAPLGSWRTSSPRTVVYTGDHGLKWVAYPDGWPCESYSQCYQPAEVLSVHDGVLDFWLHDGRLPNGAHGAMGADISPLIPTTGTPYQTYGRYEARIKVIFNDAPHLNQYHIAWLLWPKPGNCAESDFPEMDLNRRLVLGFDHLGCRYQKYFFAKIDLTKWHTLTQEWGPGFRRYYLDGRLVGQSTQDVYRGPERWQLQTEAHNIRGDTTSGHLLVDWVWIGAP